MGRIPKNRPGYDDFDCVGEPPYVIPPQACPPANGYKHIPPQLKEGVSENDYENLSLIEGDARLRILDASCWYSLNPFTGSFVDMYKAFVDNGLDPLLGSSCYEADGRYPYGYAPARPTIGMFNDCGFGTTTGKRRPGPGGGGIDTDGSSSSSSFSDSSSSTVP